MWKRSMHCMVSAFQTLKKIWSGIVWPSQMWTEVVSNVCVCVCAQGENPANQLVKCQNTTLLKLKEEKESIFLFPSLLAARVLSFTFCRSSHCLAEASFSLSGCVIHSSSSLFFFNIWFDLWSVSGGVGYGLVCMPSIHLLLAQKSTPT